MNASARDLTQEAEQLATTIAECSGRMEQTLKSFLESLTELSEADPNDLFERRVADHRATVAATESLLCTLNGAGTSFLRSAQGFPELHRELERVLPAAYRSLRIVRTLSAKLAGQLPHENQDILETVSKLIAKRAEQTARRWTPEERRAFTKRKIVDPAETEAWLNS